MNTHLTFKNTNPVLLVTTILILAASSCATVKKNDSPIEEAPEHKTPRLPQLKNAEVKALWVPEKIEADRWEEGHYLYIIEKPSTWRMK